MPRELAQRSPVDLIIDASSIINLYNGEALDIVTQLSDRRLCLSPLVIGECGPSCAAELLRLEKSGSLRFDPQTISAELFLQMLEDFDLGEGETECLALSVTEAYVFCCDDGRARNIGKAKLGADRVVGSLRLLRWSVEDALINADRAFAIYQKMKGAGGFLPDMTRDWFAGA